MFAKLAAAALLTLAVSPAWSVNKCTGADGAVSYQEAPCVPGAGGQKLKLQPVPASTPTEVKFANAIASGKIMIGMSAEQVRRAWGSPTKINGSTGSYGRHEQWVYDRGNFRSQYVYIQNGVVSSMQSPSE
jgi:hypothetical protein